MDNSEAPSQQLLGTTAASQLLGVHPKTLERWAKQGRLTVTRLPGGRKRFRREELLGLLTVDDEDRAAS